MLPSADSNADGLFRCLHDHRVLWVCGGAAATQEEAAAVKAKQRAAKEGVSVGSVVFPEGMELCDNLELRVPLFMPDQVGAATQLGPMGLGAVVHGCRALRDAQQAAGQEYMCVVCSNLPGKAANSLLLVGAYLVLSCGVSAHQAGRLLLAAQAGRRPPQVFPRPWSRLAFCTRDSLTTQDVLQGLEAALQHGWLDYQRFDVRKRHEVALAYDVAPVFSMQLLPESSNKDGRVTAEKTVRVRFWISADPVTTVVDPEPRPDPPEVLEEDPMGSDQDPTGSDTDMQHARAKARAITSMSASIRVRRDNFSRLDSMSRSTGLQGLQVVTSSMGVDALVSHDSGRSMASLEVRDRSPALEWRRRSTLSDQASPGFARRRSTWSGASSTRSGGRHPLTFSRNTSTQSIQKQASDLPVAERPVDLPAFATWLKDDLNCMLMVRCNFPNEPGLGGSYGDFFERWGLNQVDLPFPDMSAPSYDHVESLIVEVTEVLKQLQEDGQAGEDFAVVVHCKAGMGRSMASLAALAVALVPGLSAAALFGWARLTRPGSVQTAVQERFIRSLDEEDQPTCGCLRWKSRSDAPARTPSGKLAGAASQRVCSKGSNRV